MTIPEHIGTMRRGNLLPLESHIRRKSGESFRTEPMMLAVPVSDLVANLLRPCFHCDGFGPYRLFYFDAEPIERTDYWCCCFFAKGGAAQCALEFRQVRFDPRRDKALDAEGNDLLDSGLVWAAALVPLVVDGSAVSPVTIAQKDYDLRQLFGRNAEERIRYAYAGWYDEWDERVARVLEEHQMRSRPFATFYHSILAFDTSGNVHVYQTEGTLPELAKRLSREGMAAAGVLDSGGSCALYDAWMASYLNHSWYFREPRGAILVFELTSTQRIPEEDRSDSWVRRRKE